MVMNPFIKSKKDSPTTGEESIMFSIQQVVTNLGDEFHSLGGSTILVSKDLIYLIVGTLVSSILVSTGFIHFSFIYCVIENCGNDLIDELNVCIITLEVQDQTKNSLWDDPYEGFPTTKGQSFVFGLPGIRSFPHVQGERNSKDTPLSCHRFHPPQENKAYF